MLRFFTVGRKEDNFYLNISQLFAASIGHGAIVRRYSGNIDQNLTRVGAQLDAHGRWGGFEAFVGDVVQPQHFVAGLAFISRSASSPAIAAPRSGSSRSASRPRPTSRRRKRSAAYRS